MTATTTRDPKAHWLALFAASEKTPAPPAIARLRQAGIAAFDHLGFPSARDEDWKFTGLAALHRHEFTADAPPPALPAAPAGVTVSSLADALAKSPALVEAHLGRIADHKTLPLVALNTAFLSDGVFLHVPAGVACATPILIDHGPGFRRVLVVVEANAQAAVVERYSGSGTYFTSAVVEVHLGENASLDHYKIQREGDGAFHLATMAVVQYRASTSSTCYLGLGGQLVRHEVRVRFAGEGGEATVNGLYQAAGTQHMDNHTVIDHAVPHCSSHELYKGVLSGKSRGVFNGKIFVREDAQKTDAKQTNRTLLLSDDATINTKPQLEIFADDVKCTHGATVGQLDEQQLFYLKSRGIDDAQARALLTFAFANDIVSRVAVPELRHELEAILLEAHHLPRLDLPSGGLGDVSPPSSPEGLGDVSPPSSPEGLGDVSPPSSRGGGVMSIQQSIQSVVASMAPPPAFDARRLRDDFPALRQKVHGKPLVYLDNAATTQKPRAVLEAMDRFYTHDNANIHRAVHQLSERATRQYEAAREKVRAFLNAAGQREIVFTRGATEAINLVAQSWGRANLKPGDEILVTMMEHHSNIVPWQMVAQQTGAVVRFVPIDDAGDLRMDEYARMLGPRTRLVSAVHMSNSLGTLNPVDEIIRLAHAAGAKVLIDASQSAAHLPLDVQEMDCDFLVFSGHKVYGPTGTGVLYGKFALLDAMPPWMGGGDMIARVTTEGTTYADVPARFEAGTPNIAGFIGLAAALDWLRGVGVSTLAAHEDALLDRATQLLRAIPGVRVVGDPAHRAGVLPFVVDDPPMSALDVGTRLDLEGIAVRTGHHCCQPLMDRLGLPATARASFACYNTMADVDALAEALRRILDDARRRVRPLPVEDAQRCPAEVALCNSTAQTCPPKRDVMYAPRMADSPRAAGDEIAEVFGLLDDWQERYQYLIELGEKLPEMPAEFKTECTRVHGCQSVVHITAREKPDSPGVVEFLADSDGELVKGLIGLLEHVYSGQNARDILAFDMEGFFRELGLDQHLSLNRRNGLASMVNRIRQHAAGLVGG